MDDHAGLVGRGDELARVRQAFEPGWARTVVVCGPAGIGKSRLLAAIADERAALGDLVVRGGSVVIPGIEDVTTPYGPFSEAVRALANAGVDDELNARARRWLELLTGDPEGALDPTQHRRTRLLDLLADAAAVRPVTMVIEDVHWADVSSLGTLVFLIRNLDRQAVRVLVSSRPFEPGAAEHAASVLDHLRRLPTVDWLDLDPLADADIAELIRASGRLDEQRVADIVALAHGHPLSAVELARAPADQRVPRSVAASVAARLAIIPASARRAVETAAVLGTEVRHDELAAALAGDVPDVADAIAGAGEVLAPTPDGYRFGHALERDAVHLGLPAGRRQELHRTVATALARLPLVATPPARAERASRIAGHWAATGDVEAIVESSAAAARAAADVAAYPEALAHARRALDAGPRPGGGTAGYAGTALDAAQYARWCGRPELGVAIMEAALSHPMKPREEVLLLERLGWLRREIGEGDAAGAAYLRAVDLLDAVGDTEVACRVRAGYAALLLTRFRLAEALAEARRAVDLAGSDPSAARASALNTLGTVLAVTGEPEEGLRLLEHSRDVALAAGSEEDVWRYVGNATFVLQNLGRSGEALDLALAAHARAVRGGVSRSLAVLPVITNAISACVQLGRWDDAVTMIDDALQGEPPPAREAHLRLYAATVMVLRGAPDDAASEISAARRIGLGSGDPSVDVRAARLEVELHGSRHQFDRARSAVEEGLRRLDDTDDPEMTADLLAAALRVEADAAAVNQRDDGTVRILVHRLDAVEAGIDQDDQPDETRLAVALARAEAARADGADTAAEWERLAVQYAQLPCPQAAGYARLRQAEAALAARNRTAAQRAAVLGQEAVAELGPSAIGAALADLVRRARLGAAPAAEAAQATPPDTAGLTRREREVLTLLVEGRSNRQIARQLGMSEKTASVHVSNLMAKLGVSSRTRAAAVATRRGLVPPVIG